MQLIKHTTLLNLILLSIVITSFKFKVLPVLDYKPDFTIVPQTIKENNDKAFQKDDEKNSKEFDLFIESGELSSYSIIAEQNLFHPERKIVIKEDKKKEEAEETEFILYGTIVAGAIRVAFMESKVTKRPQRRRRRSRRRKNRKIQKKEKDSKLEKPKKRFYEGDILEGYTLEKINTENVVLVKGEEVVTVNVYDPANPKKRSSVRSRIPNKNRRPKIRKRTRTITLTTPRKVGRAKAQQGRRY